MIDLSQFIEQFREHLVVSAGAWLSEIVLVGTIVLLLLQKMVLPAWKRLSYGLMLAGTTLALALLAVQLNGRVDGGHSVTLFVDVLRLDGLGAFFRVFIVGFALVFTVLTWLTRWPRVDELAEFYVLFLGSVVGMSVMVTAENLLVIFLGMEMASLPSYVLAGFEKRQRRASEAAMKFAIFGAAMAGVMLYGLTLLGGALGSLHLPTMANRLAELVSTRELDGHGLPLVLGTLMVLAGIGFKLSAVPFHFWLPDVFEGAAAEVGAFLSIISKAAALGLLTRFTFTFLGGHPGAAFNAMAPLIPFVVGTLSLMAAVTCTYGNLAAYGQRNLKRLLGYSTIAHAGYLMMPLAAAVALLPVDLNLARWAVAAMLFYLVVYLFMNLVAFSGAAFLQKELASEDIEDYAGLVKVAPGFVVCLTLALFSLVGLPPLGGFAGKFAVFAGLISAQLWALFVIAAVNTVISLFYYVRVIKVMVLDPPRRELPPVMRLASLPGLFLVVLTVPIVALGVFWQPVFEMVSRTVGATQ